MPHTVHSHTTTMAEHVRLESATVAAPASKAATRAPYAAGAAKANGSVGETTPGTRKLRPMNRRSYWIPGVFCSNGVRA